MLSQPPRRRRAGPRAPRPPGRSRPAAGRWAIGVAPAGGVAFRASGSAEGRAMRRGGLAVRL